MSEFNWDDIINKGSGEKSPPATPQPVVEEKREEKDAVLNEETLESINKQVETAKKQLRSAVATAKRNVRKVNIRKHWEAVARKRNHIIAVVGFIGVVALGGYFYTHHTPAPTPKPNPVVEDQTKAVPPTPTVEQPVVVDPVLDASEPTPNAVKPETKPEAPKAKAAVEVAKPPSQKPRPKAAQQEANPKPLPQQKDNWNKREANKQLDDFFNN